MKKRKQFVCSECGNISPVWAGKCNQCNSWNSFIETETDVKKKVQKSNHIDTIQNINEIHFSDTDIYLTKIDDINNFFGNGIVKGSIILLSGEPGVGKSTFLLYLSGILQKKIFYFTGEESKEQIKNRFLRVGSPSESLYISDISEVESIISVCEKQKPEVIFIDSIQTIYSNEIDNAPGNITQIRTSIHNIIEFAKKHGITVFIVGHINKTGDIAGPKVVEHMVDVVVFIETCDSDIFRIIRSRKNRYGNVHEILIFQLKQHGIELIDNPALFFIDKDDNEANIGKCKTIVMEGRRPLIIDIEVLVVPSVYNGPRRFAEGIDGARLNRISAIMDKHLSENLNNYDIYFKISGGLKSDDVVLDTAVAVAIYSSKHKIFIDNDLIVLGELSLTGKIRPVKNLDLRLNECNKFSFNNIFIPESNKYKENVKLLNSIEEIKEKVFKNK